MPSSIATPAELVTGQRMDVEEFLRRDATWRMLENGVYRPQEPPMDGILRSQVFPGLWLDADAFWADDGARMLAALNAGLAAAK